MKLLMHSHQCTVLWKCTHTIALWCNGNEATNALAPVHCNALQWYYTVMHCNDTTLQCTVMKLLMHCYTYTAPLQIHSHCSHIVMTLHFSRIKLQCSAQNVQSIHWLKLVHFSKPWFALTVQDTLMIRCNFAVWSNFVPGTVALWLCGWS